MGLGVPNKVPDMDDHDLDTPALPQASFELRAALTESVIDVVRAGHPSVSGPLSFPRTSALWHHPKAGPQQCGEKDEKPRTLLVATDHPAVPLAPATRFRLIRALSAPRKEVTATHG